MADNSPIEWTDATWNPVRGCSRISPGCGGPNHQGGCYAEKIAARFSGPGQPFEGFAERTAHGGRWTGKMALVDDMLAVPLHWRKPRRVFVNSMSDLFHADLPDEAIDKVFAVMALAPQHTYQVLTKRAKRMREYLSNSRVPFRIDEAAATISNRHAFDADFWPLPNVWLGVSTEDQPRADERIPHLLATPAAKRFISAEPLLGPVDLTAISYTHAPGFFGDALAWHHRGKCHEDEGLIYPAIDWVIAGGESGKGARPMHPDWARRLRDQCAAVGVPFFFKQWGEWLAGENLSAQPGSLAQWQDGDVGQHRTCKDRPDGKTPEWRHFGVVGQPGAFTLRVGKKRAGAMLDGKMHRDFPT